MHPNEYIEVQERNARIAEKLAVCTDENLERLLRLSIFSVCEVAGYGKMSQDKKIVNQLAELLGKPVVFSPKGYEILYLSDNPTEEDIALAIEWVDEE
jgi:hypothetical protein